MATKNGRRYTDDEIKQFVSEYVQEGTTQLAWKLERTPQAVRRLLKRRLSSAQWGALIARRQEVVAMAPRATFKPSSISQNN